MRMLLSRAKLTIHQRIQSTDGFAATPLVISIRTLPPRRQTPPTLDTVILEEDWKERKQAQNSIKTYLTDIPTTIAFIHGPQGSGKTRLVEKKTAESGRSTLVIDCQELLKATTDSQLVGTLATQTGYWPMFTFLNSIGSLIDLASIGLIGQKSEYHSFQIMINY